MKITNEDRKLFKETYTKYNLSENGFLASLFKRKLKNKLDNDIELQQALKDADIELGKIRNFAKDAERQGVKIPFYLKRYL